jgi:TIR domain-containing protein
LSQRMPDARIFMDLDSIEPGLDFAEVIEEAVDSSAVLLALIGRQWLTLTGDDGARKLDNPGDYVRFEVTTALERGVRVIPVLIDGARPLREQDLPTELHKLARLNAAKLTWERYQDDADRLLDLIQGVLATVGEERLAGEERERLDRKGGEEADRFDPEEIARQYQEAQEAAAPGGTAAFIPWVHVPSSGDLTATPDSGTVATAATAAQTPRAPQASPSQPPTAV